MVLQSFVLVSGWNHILSTTVHTFNRHVTTLPFGGTDDRWKTRSKIHGRCCACFGGPRMCACTISHVCETGQLCFARCCCKTIYRTGRSGRRAMKQDYNHMVQQKDAMTRQPGWRKNMPLKLKILKLANEIKTIKEEIKTRKNVLNQQEEHMLGTFEDASCLVLFVRGFFIHCVF